MKTVVLTSSSTKSSTASTMEDDRSETRDTSYFPGCRKDANCNCEMCLASINATLDLMPFSNQRSSLSNFSFSKPFPRSPVAFDPSILSTPRSNARRIPESPSLRSTARLNFREKVKEKKKRRGFGIGILRLVLILCLICAAQIGFPWMVSRVLGPKLSPDIVRNLGEKSWVMQDLSGRFMFLQKELQGFVDGKISRCSYTNSTWKMTQDGLLLNSRCTLYKSATEEVSIWGWPLQTAGLLTTGLSSRSFTILSGRVTEWLDGKNGYSIRKANSSWVHRKWSTSLVQLDPNTWVLEYQRSQILENTKLLSAALEFLNFRISREIGRLKREFWMLSAFVNQFGEYSTRTPTPT